MTNLRVVVTQYGGPDALQIVEEDLPQPRSGQVRVKVKVAGVSLPDLMAREGIHPETPAVPFTPGWDLVGDIDAVGEGVVGFKAGQTVAAMPISGAYARYVCLPERDLVAVPPGSDPAEAVSLILNYITAYQMMHRSVTLKPGQSVLIHGASGGVGTALLQLGRLFGLSMFGTCSAKSADTVLGLGGTPIDYRQADFVEEIRRLTGDGVDVVFDSIGGDHVWRSREALRPGGSVVAYGMTGELRGGRLAGGGGGRRNPLYGVGSIARQVIGSWLAAGGRRVVPYSIQWRMRLRRAEFRQDLETLLGLLNEGKLKPIIARRFPLAEARQAQEFLGKGGVVGKIVLDA